MNKSRRDRADVVIVGEKVDCNEHARRSRQPGERQAGLHDGDWMKNTKRAERSESESVCTHRN